MNKKIFDLRGRDASKDATILYGRSPICLPPAYGSVFIHILMMSLFIIHLAIIIPDTTKFISLNQNTNTLNLNLA